MKKRLIQNRTTKGDSILQALPLACADEKAAVEFMEAQRWGSDACCPRCGSVNVYQMKDRVTGERQANYRWLCKDCRKAKLKHQFTVRTGTVFEDSKAELRHWCFAFWRASTSKKGVSALEIHRQTGLSYKTCLFMLNRIRFAMADSGPSILGPVSGIVEADETFVGGKLRRYTLAKRATYKPKTIVAAVLERDGAVRTRIIPGVTSENVREFITDNVSLGARLMTDESYAYYPVGKQMRSHETVRHSDLEYARGDVTTNTIEGFFAIVKRGLNGIYHSVSKEHLHRYMAEFEFRYTHRELEDGPRAVAAIKAAQGKRLMYRAS
ncbi:MAG TPA: IS1595 family transposase [Nevskiaceae bacterium]|nr:IS1595 family transposase [Nevskiaceae bacterium]